MEAASGSSSDRRRASCSALSTPLLLTLLTWAHLGYLLFKPEHQFAMFASGLGLVATVFAWNQRGKRFTGRWFLCLWGAFEGSQVFVCQAAQVQWPIPGPHGMCSVYTGLPLFGWGLGLLAVVASLVYRDSDGSRPPNS
jgi:hypothetical protein